MVVAAPARILFVEPTQPAAALSSVSFCSAGASEGSLLYYLRVRTQAIGRKRSSAPALCVARLEVQNGRIGSYHLENKFHSDEHVYRPGFGQDRKRQDVAVITENSPNSICQWGAEEFDNASPELPPVHHSGKMPQRSQHRMAAVAYPQPYNDMMEMNQNWRKRRQPLWVQEGTNRIPIQKQGHFMMLDHQKGRQSGAVVHPGLAQFDSKMPVRQRNGMMEIHENRQRSHGGTGHGAAVNGRGTVKLDSHAKSRMLPPWDAQRQLHDEQVMEAGHHRFTRQMQEKAPWNPQRRYSNLTRLVSGEAPNQTPMSFAKINCRAPPWEYISSKSFPGLNIKKRHTEGELKGGDNQSDKGHNSSHSAIARIVEKLKTVQESKCSPENVEPVSLPQTERTNHLFLPGAKQYFVNRTLGTVHQPPVQPIGADIDARFPWEVEENTQQEKDKDNQKRVIAPTLADLTIPTYELKRLRTLSIHVRERIKVDKSGVTDTCALSIIDKFRTCEVVKVKCEGPASSNMKKTIADLEKKTGGLVIWKAGSVVVLYRGKNDGQPVAEIASSLLEQKLENLVLEDEKKLKAIASNYGGTEAEGAGFKDLQDDMPNQEQVLSKKKKRARFEPKDREEYNAEVEEILNEIGPRYEEWIGPWPIPVDVDLLAQVSNFCPPFRFLPYGMRPNISNTEATLLRRLSRPLSPHFVIGRNSPLKTLAAAMVQLWEKSAFAKIGLKRGVLNSNQERMAAEIKRLTGGALLCRDKQSITLHRGQDFLPKDVAAALSERANMDRALEEEEERWRGDRNIAVYQDPGSSHVEPSWVHLVDADEQTRLRKEAEKARWVQMVHTTERKLARALRKKTKAEKELNKVEELINPVTQPTDSETLADEELFMFRKLGLRMKSYLLVGRRSVFSGTVQNMHLHWKHRELVKLLIKERDPVRLEETVKMIVHESGGILVAVEPTTKGQAIIVYRGKNYKRPRELRPPNLLTKRLALQRFVEIQRHQSLTRNIQNIERELAYLRAGLNKLKEGLHGMKINQMKDAALCDSLSDIKDSKSGHVGDADGVNQLESAANIMKFADAPKGQHLEKETLQRLCELGPVFKAEPLTKLEAHYVRKQALSIRKASSFNLGNGNSLAAVAKAIRIYFVDHAFVKVGVKHRPTGTSIQDIIDELEDLTGGILYFQGSRKIVLYRGWPNGAKMPMYQLYDVLSPDQCGMLELEESFLDDLLNKDRENDASGSDPEGSDGSYTYDGDDVDETDSDDDATSMVGPFTEGDLLYPEALFDDDNAATSGDDIDTLHGGEQVENDEDYEEIEVDYDYERVEDDDAYIFRSLSDECDHSDDDIPTAVP